jgi:hypothetical protein
LIAGDLNFKLRVDGVSNKHIPVIKAGVGNIGRDPVQTAGTGLVPDGNLVNIGRGVPGNSLGAVHRHHFPTVR